MLISAQKFPIYITAVGENTISCQKMEECFFNVHSITINEECCLLVESSDLNAVLFDVEIEGVTYKNVEFQIVENDATGVFINEKYLNGEKAHIKPAAATKQILHESNGFVKRIQPSATPIAESVLPSKLIDVEVLRNELTEHIDNAVKTTALHEVFERKLWQMLYQ